MDSSDNNSAVLCNRCRAVGSSYLEFGDLGRATYKTDFIMLIVVFIGIAYFRLVSWRYNALLSGDNAAKSMGIDVDKLRFVSLLIASLITAVCVSYLGIIGFVGIICPHVMKKILTGSSLFHPRFSAVRQSAAYNSRYFIQKHGKRLSASCRSNYISSWGTVLYCYHFHKGGC
jgi:hypothetical protein